MSTPNLAITHIAANQNQKEVTANTAFDEFDEASTAQVSINCAGSADITPSFNTVAYNFCLKLTGVLTGNIHLVLPAHPHLWLIKNATTGGSPGYTITVQVTGAPGTTVVLSEGDNKLVYSDGTNIIHPS